MKYTEKQWQELADKVALYKQLEDEINNAKEDIRQMTEEDIINKYVNVNRKDNTTTTYPENYTTELNLVKAKLKQKYKDEIVKVTKENYSIELQPMKQAQTKANTITNDIIRLSNAKLKNVASQTKINNKK